MRAALGQRRRCAAAGRGGDVRNDPIVVQAAGARALGLLDSEHDQTARAFNLLSVPGRDGARSTFATTPATSPTTGLADGDATTLT
jgi:hypothetical protein